MYTTEALERNSFNFPSKIAVKDEKRSLTYHELNERTSILANCLIEMKISKGDNIALLLRNCVEFVEVHFAVQKIGAVSVPLNTKLSSSELEYIINNSDAKVIFYNDDFNGKLIPIRNKLKNIKYFIPLSNENAPNGVCLEELLKNKKTVDTDINIKENDKSTIFYTSGTTGRPKGAILTHANTIWNTVTLLMTEPFYPADITMIIPPLYHVAGLNTLLFTHLFIGGTSVLVEGFNPKGAMKTIEREKITNAFLVPAMFNAILNLENLDSYEMSQFRLFINGGAILPVQQKLKVLKIFKSVGIIDCYGLTEASPIVTILSQKDSLIKTDSVGKVTVTYQARVIASDGKDAATGVDGELLIKGPQIIKGYYRDAKKTADAIEGGWLHTGDIVRRDAEGFIYVVDRKKDMIITGGENVYPAEVEAVLYKHPKVYEAAVVGVPDKKWRERIKAFIVLKLGEKTSDTEIMEFCKEYIASYKKPTVIEFVENLPRTASGKVMKSELRKN